MWRTCWSVMTESASGSGQMAGRLSLPPPTRVRSAILYGGWGEVAFFPALGLPSARQSFHHKRVFFPRTSILKTLRNQPGTGDDQPRPDPHRRSDGRRFRRLALYRARVALPIG